MWTSPRFPEVLIGSASTGAPPIKAGDVLDRKYRVERVLGTGGMGMVVAARHVQLGQLGQRVARKFMLKEASDDPGNAEHFATPSASRRRGRSGSVPASPSTAAGTTTSGPRPALTRRLEPDTPPSLAAREGSAIARHPTHRTAELRDEHLALGPRTLLRRGSSAARGRLASSSSSVVYTRSTVQLCASIPVAVPALWRRRRCARYFGGRATRVRRRRRPGPFARRA